MGCEVSVDVSLRINASAKRRFFEILKELAARKSSYKWVSSGFETSETIEEALDCWRYEAELDEKVVVVNEYTGQKLGDDDILWTALAPVVEDGGYVQFRGGDGAQWRYEFKGGVMTEKTAKVVWE